MSPGDVEQEEHWTELWRETEINRSIHALNAGRDPIWRLLRRIQQLVPPGRALDHGCGFGRVSLHLQRSGWDMVGVDFSFQGLEAARAAGVERLACSDVRALPLRTQTFDAAISFGVVEHIAEGPQAALIELRRVLKRGAVALLTVPYENPLRRARSKLAKDSTSTRQGYDIKKLRTFPDKVSPGFYQYAFTPAEFTQHLNDAGFSVEDRVAHSVFKGLRDMEATDHLHRLLQTRHGSAAHRRAGGSSPERTRRSHYLRTAYDETHTTLLSKITNSVGAPLVGHMMAYFVRGV